MSRGNRDQEAVRETLMRIISAKSDLVDGMEFHADGLTTEQRTAVESVMTDMVNLSKKLVTTWTMLFEEERSTK